MAGISSSHGLPLPAVGLYNARTALRRAGPTLSTIPNDEDHYVLNGPGIDSRGAHTDESDDRPCLAPVEELCRDAAARVALGIEFRHSNHEGALVDWIHERARKAACGIVINPAGYTSAAIPGPSRRSQFRSSRCTSAISMREKLSGAAPICRRGVAS
jgi:hypothetical protein